MTNSPTERPTGAVPLIAANRPDSPASKSLQEYVEFLHSTEKPAVLSPDGRSAWVPGVRAELQRLPMECTTEASKEILRHVLVQRGVWIASYMLHPTARCPANCFDYLCTDMNYRIEDLEKNARRDIRRGLRCFEVRPCSWNELVDKGFSAYADTETRHGHSAPPSNALRRFAEQNRGCRSVKIWGAWRGKDLAAWIRVVKMDDWAFITTACSRNNAMRDCPNNALTFDATRTFLVEEKRSCVSYGISSIQATSNIKSLHRFKLRMGFAPVPRCRMFVAHPLLRPLVESKAASWVWDRLAALRPSSQGLQKAAGMARMLSGRHTDPLAWANEADSG